MLANLRLAKFTFYLRPKDIIHLPKYKGGVFRGAFGYTFKKIVCALKNSECEKCILREKCVYAYTFETPVPKDSKKMRKYTKAPHPFIIEPPNEEKILYNNEEKIQFCLVLVGKSVDFLPYFIFTFLEIGKKGIGKGRGKYILEEVRDLEGKKVFSSEGNLISISFSDLYPDDSIFVNPSKNRIKITFLTPARIKFDGKLTMDLTFHILIRNILRRLSLLAYFHDSKEMELDYSGIIEKAKSINIISNKLNWYDWERYSTRQDTRMKLGGFVGEIVYEGEFSPFWTYLKIGEYVHVGKGSSFGLGRYKID